MSTKLPQIQREEYLNIQAYRANILIRMSDQMTQTAHKIKDIMLWKEDIMPAMNKFSNLGKLHLLVDEFGCVCVVPAFYLTEEVRAQKNKHFAYDPESEVYILKKPYRNNWHSLVIPDYITDIELYPRP